MAERFRQNASEQGVAAVEFALVATLLFTLIFGIIIFGVLYGYRQQLTQATAEGARAAVGIPYTASDTTVMQNAARVQVNRSLSGTKRSCPTLSAGTSGSLTVDGITCSFLVYPCAAPVPGVGAPTGSDDCIQVRIVLDNDTKPLLVKFPFLAAMMPKTLSSTYVVRVSGFAT